MSPRWLERSRDRGGGIEVVPGSTISLTDLLRGGREDLLSL
jgi:hypothetical protein